ncbi:alpha/beta fold hydrolase [Liquorilactobacillus uvarum]|uniref:alpha/beta fold hydrolase n=1 Tax=Liquorilactobacillus uvarum TaxID=303240 RepID=UPI00288BA8AD|nr:alpha/beta hydrolase [Liquorilactobacillus uvarum]
MKRSIDGINIHYVIEGQGQPVVLLHGLCLDLNFMKINYSQFLNCEKYQQIYIDLPGMGKSDSFSNPHPSSDYLLELIIKLIDTLNIDKFYICGHSYGGYLALGIAYKIPARVKGLFLSCPVVTANSKKRITEKPLCTRKNKFSSHASSKYIADFLKMNVVINELNWKKYLAEIVVGLEKCNFNFVKELQDNNFKYYELADEQKIKEWHTEIPTFFILGKHDHDVGYKEQSALESNFKKSNLVVLEDAGHNLPIDQGNIFSACVKTFFS